MVRPRVHHAARRFGVTFRSWTSTAAIFSELPLQAPPVRWRWRPMLRAQHRWPPHSAATPRNMACVPMRQKIRPASCNARSTKRPAHKRRWRCRPAIIAPVRCGFRAARNSSAYAVRPNSSSTVARRCCWPKAPTAWASPASRWTAGTFPCPIAAAWSTASPAATCVSMIARYQAAAATASGSSRSRAISPAISSRGPRRPRSCRSTRSA